MDEDPDIGADGVVPMGDGVDHRLPDGSRRVLLDPDPPRADDHLSFFDLFLEVCVGRIDRLPDRAAVFPAPLRLAAFYSDRPDPGVGDAGAGVGEEEHAGVGEHAVPDGADAAEVAVPVVRVDGSPAGALHRPEIPVDEGGVGFAFGNGRRSVPGDGAEFGGEHEDLLDGERANAGADPDVDDPPDRAEGGAFLDLDDEDVPVVDGDLVGGDAGRRDDRLEGARDGFEGSFCVGAHDGAAVVDADDEVAAVCVGEGCDFVVDRFCRRSFELDPLGLSGLDEGEEGVEVHVYC